MRLCVNTGCRLHLIEPIGFQMDNRSLRRAGLDYREFAEVRKYRTWNQWLEGQDPHRMVAFTTTGTVTYDRFRFQSGDALVFGPETRGLPDDVLAGFDPAHRLRLPMLMQERSLNLSNAVAVAVYEAWRQVGYAGGR